LRKQIISVGTCENSETRIPVGFYRFQRVPSDPVRSVIGFIDLGGGVQNREMGYVWHPWWKVKVNNSWLTCLFSNDRSVCFHSVHPHFSEDIRKMLLFQFYNISYKKNFSLFSDKSEYRCRCFEVYRLLIGRKKRLSHYVFLLLDGGLLNSSLEW